MDIYFLSFTASSFLKVSWIFFVPCECSQLICVFVKETLHLHLIFYYIFNKHRTKQWDLFNKSIFVYLQAIIINTRNFITVLHKLLLKVKYFFTNGFKVKISSNFVKLKLSMYSVPYPFVCKKKKVYKQKVKCTLICYSLNTIWKKKPKIKHILHINVLRLDRNINCM